MKKNLMDTLMVLVVLILIFVVYMQGKKISHLKETNKYSGRICDSLKSEVFIRDIQIGRYEIIMERAEEELSKECLKQLQILKGQTE